MAGVLVLAQPKITMWVEARRARRTGAAGRLSTVLTTAGVTVTACYGGYFGAAQGILLMSVLGIGVAADTQRLNAMKNVLATIANAVSAVTFLVIGHDRIDLTVVCLIAVGSVLGGWVGGRVGRRLSPPALRVVLAGAALAAVIGFVAR
jgi:uncharacterized membrane protein YfcA